MFQVVLQSWGASVTAPHHRGCQQKPPSWGACDAPCDVPSVTKVSFFDNLVKKLDSSWSSYKKYLVFNTYP